MADDKMDVEDQFVIKPQATAPAVDTSDWPLLLKNYDKLLVRTGHFTPIPMGAAPMKRDIKSYVSSGVINLVGLFLPLFASGQAMRAPAGKVLSVNRMTDSLEHTRWKDGSADTRNRTSPQTLRRMKSSHGSSACFGT